MIKYKEKFLNIHDDYEDNQDITTNQNINKNDEAFEKLRQNLINSERERILHSKEYYGLLSEQIKNTSQLLLDISQRMRQTSKKVSKLRKENRINGRENHGGGGGGNNFKIIMPLLMEEQNIMQDLSENKIISKEKWFVKLYKRYLERREILDKVIEKKETSNELGKIFAIKMGVSNMSFVNEEDRNAEVEKRIIEILSNGILKYEKNSKKIKKFKSNLRRLQEEYDNDYKQLYKAQKHFVDEQAFFSDLTNAKRRQEYEKEIEEIKYHKKKHPRIQEKILYANKIEKVNYNTRQRVKDVSKYFEESREPKVFLLTNKIPDYLDQYGNEYYLKAKHMPLLTKELNSLKGEHKIFSNIELSQKFDPNRTLDTSYTPFGSTSFYLRIRNKRTRYANGITLYLYPTEEQQQNEQQKKKTNQIMQNQFITTKITHFSRYKNRPIATISLINI